MVTADVHMASLLELPFGSDIASFKLLGMGNSVPLALFFYYLPTELGREAIEEIQNYEAEKGWFSFTRYYRGKRQIDFSVAHQTFEALNSTTEQSELMQLPLGSALFKVTSIIYTRQEKPIELRYAYYRGDRYKFNISRDVVS